MGIYRIYDYIELGSSPIEEDCVQVSSEREYITPMKEECRRYKELLQKRFPFAEFRIMSFPHDFGTYYEVVVMFYEIDPQSEEKAYFVEENLPNFWTDEEVFSEP